MVDKMRYFCYNELGDNDKNIVVTKSESEIREEYWSYWYDRMCKKFGQNYVDQMYSFEDCLEDWIISNWAWESKNE